MTRARPPKKPKRATTWAEVPAKEKTPILSYLRWALDCNWHKDANWKRAYRAAIAELRAAAKRRKT